MQQAFEISNVSGDGSDDDGAVILNDKMVCMGLIFQLDCERFVQIAWRGSNPLSQRQSTGNSPGTDALPTRRPLAIPCFLADHRRLFSIDQSYARLHPQLDINSGFLISASGQG